MAHRSNCDIRTSWQVTRIMTQLLALINEYRKKGQKRLPTIQRLCTELGASTHTIHKALGLLKAQGVVSARPRSGIWIIPRQGNDTAVAAEQQMPTPLVTEHLWLRVKNQIKTDILNGKYPPGSLLPIKKELTFRYGTTFHTLRKVFSALVKEMQIVPIKRRYRVFLPTTSQARPLIFVIMPSGIMLNNAYTMAMDFTHCLELECAQRAIDWKMYTIDEVAKISSQKQLLHPLCKQNVSRTVIGYVLWRRNMHMAETYRQLYSFLDNTNLPIAVFDNSAAANSGIVSRNKKLRLFSTSAGNEQGGIIARYLRSNGHESMAFFNAFPKGAWSCNRLAGIRQVYAEAGLSSNVHLFDVDASGLWEAVLLGNHQKFPGKKFEHSLLRTVQLIEPGQESVKELYSKCGSVFWRYALGKLMRPCFESALKNKAITAWVGINDDVALCALTFLCAHDIRVPQEISVVGFDDSFDGRELQLTSYNFNVRAIMAAMFDNLLGGTTTTTAPKSMPVRIDGMIIERATTTHQ